MKRSIQKRKRIFLLFFLGIGIPSVLLGYLAFRGIQNDQALIEKTKRNEYQKLVGVITRDEVSQGEQGILEKYFTTKEIYANFFNLNGEPASKKLRVTLHNTLKSLMKRSLISKNQGGYSADGGRALFCLTRRGQTTAKRILTSEEVKQRKKEEEKEKEPQMGEKKLTPEKIVRLVRRSLDKQNERF
jgi:hypothetical protein